MAFGSANAGTVEVDVEGDFSKFERDLKGKGSAAGGKFGSSFGSSMGSKIAAAGALYLGANFAKGAISQASDLEESINVTGLAFGDARGIIDETAKSASTLYGVSESAYRGLSAQIGNIFVQSGVARKEAADLTNDLVLRATDVGSAWNAETSDVTDSFNSALIGSYEPMRKFGVILDKATVKQYALENGLVDANGEVDAQSEKLATAALIMEQTDNVAGDFANTSDGVANSSKQVTAMWEDMQAQLATGLLPLLSVGLGLLKSLGPEGMKWAVIIGGIVVVGAKLITVLRGVGGALTLLSANPVMLILIAIAAIAIVIYKNWDTIREFFEVTLPNAFEIFGAWVARTFDPWVQRLIDVKDRAVELKDRAVEVFDTIKEKVGDAVDFGVRKLGELRDAADRALGPLDEIVGGAWNLGVSAFNTVTGRAVGGPMSAGRPYIVGEEGPELVTPGRSSYVTPADATAALLGSATPSAAGNTYNISVTVAAGAGVLGRDELERQGRELVKVIRRELDRESSAGIRTRGAMA